MTAIAPTRVCGVIPPFPVRQFTVAEYHQMSRAGVLDENDAVELLEGWIVPKMPRDPLHDAVIDIAQEILRAHLPPQWRVRVQSAITTGDSEPEPDLAVVAGPAERYANHHPGPSEVSLVIEVADSSLERDRTIKVRLYAGAGISEYWIINLIQRQVEIRSNPAMGAEYADYCQIKTYQPGQSIPLRIGPQESQLPVDRFFV